MTLEQVFIDKWRKTGELPGELNLVLSLNCDLNTVKTRILNIVPIDCFLIDHVEYFVNENILKIGYVEPSDFTVVILKPDCIRRNLQAKVIQRFLDKGLSINHIQKTRLSEKVVNRHYSEHIKQPYFDRIYHSVTFDDVYVLKITGDDVIQQVRLMVGATNPKEALPGTIRGDYGTKLPHNIIHASSDKESAKREWENLLVDLCLPKE